MAHSDFEALKARMAAVEAENAAACQRATGAEEHACQLEGWLTEAEDLVAANGKAASLQLAEVEAELATAEGQVDHKRAALEDIKAQHEMALAALQARQTELVAWEESVGAELVASKQELTRMQAQSISDREQHREGLRAQMRAAEARVVSAEMAAERRAQSAEAGRRALEAEVGAVGAELNAAADEADLLAHELG